MTPHLNNYVAQAQVADLQRRAEVARRAAGRPRVRHPERVALRGRLRVARLARATR